VLGVEGQAAADDEGEGLVVKRALQVVPRAIEFERRQEDALLAAHGAAAVTGQVEVRGQQLVARVDVGVELLQAMERVFEVHPLRGGGGVEIDAGRGGHARRVARVALAFS